MSGAPKRIRTATLDIAYEESGAADGVPVFLMHGWPYDPRCYDAVIAPLCGARARVIVPYLRGFGPTRFLSDKTPRSGQQAALGNDLREVMDALAVDRAVPAGYDWGGRAACIVAALWPQRVRGLITVNAHNIQNIPNSGIPAAPAQEHRLWYQYPIGVSCAGCSGNCGRRIGHLMTPPLNAARSRSTIPILSMSRYTPIAIAIAMRRATHHWTTSSGSSPLSPRSLCPQSHCRAKPMAFIRPRVLINTLSSFLDL